MSVLQFGILSCIIHKLMPYCLHCGHKANYIIPTNDSKIRLVCPACQYIHYDNPKVITGTLSIHNGKILLCRRAIEPKYGYWTLPAGFLELNESMADGAIRETWEEAKAVAINHRLYCLFDLPHIGQIHVMYLATLKDGAFGVGSESLECRLFAIDELPWDELSFRTVVMTLKQYVADAQLFNDRLLEYPVHQAVIQEHRNIIS